MKLFVTAFCTSFLGVLTGSVWSQETHSVSEVFPGPIQTAEGTEADSQSLEGKLVGIYFSAGWCAPCRAFTPVLTEFYEQNKDEAFEIVFVSFDKSNTEKKNYIREAGMKWLTMKGAGNRHAKRLAEKFHVDSFPTLVILDPAGNLVTLSGRSDVMLFRDTAIQRWKEPDPS